MKQEYILVAFIFSSNKISRHTVQFLSKLKCNWTLYCTVNSRRAVYFRRLVMPCYCAWHLYCGLYFQSSIAFSWTGHFTLEKQIEQR